MTPSLQGRTSFERADNERGFLWILDGLILTLAVGLGHYLGTLAGW